MIPAPFPAIEDTDAIIGYLVRLITLCEQSDIDLDLMYNEAWRIYRGEPEDGS